MTPRRNATQWQAIINSFQQSGLSAPQFCRQESIVYQSFMNWKKRLSSDSLVERVNEPIEPSFIELTQDENLPSQWQIELDLAPGVQLRIARPA